MQWYVSQRGKISGPFEEGRLAMLVQWGKVSADAFICDEHLSAWVAIKRSAFAPLFPAASSSASTLGSKPSTASNAKRALKLVALSVFIAGVSTTTAWMLRLAVAASACPSQTLWSGACADTPKRRAREPDAPRAGR